MFRKKHSNEDPLMMDRHILLLVALLAGCALGLVDLQEIDNHVSVPDIERHQSNR